jgi:hypothetical protein
VTPLTIAAFFAKRKALSALFYCVFQHNARAESHAMGVQFWVHAALFPLLLLILIWAARAFLQLGPDWKQAARRTLVLLTPAFFLLYLFCFWPLITRQDFLPALPLLAIPLAACLNGRRSSWQLLILAAILQVGAAAGYKQPFRPRNLRSQALVEDILKLTGRHDFVMDAKGETIFRNRPYYFCLESITRTQLLRGGMPDTIAKRMAATRTCVSLPNRFPTQSGQWVRRFYLPVTDQIWVAGCSLPSLPPHPPAAPIPGRPFEVGIAASYLVESASGPVQGTMDGLPCNGPVFLNPGPHLFTCNDPRSLDVIWSRAVKKGFKPLNLCP